MKHVRNVAIIVALAAAVEFLPGGGTTAETIANILGVAFFSVLAWFASIMYREHRLTILGLDEQARVLLYGGVGLAVITVVATPKLWDTPVGTLVWFVLVTGASLAVFTAYRQSREY